MFCSGCGTQLPDGSQFCSKCGAKTGDVSVSSASIDITKVLKADEFRRIVKTMDAFSKKNDGTMTLYSDRLEFKGKEDLKIPVVGITRVDVTRKGSEQMLEIHAEEIYKFMILRKSGLADAWISVNNSVNAQMSNVQSQLDSWRDAINKVCGRL